MSITCPHCGGDMGAHNAERAAAMAEMYRSGHSLKQIGAQYGITAERVRQILKKHHGLTAEDSWAARHAESRRRKAELAAAREAREATLQARIDRVAERVRAGQSIGAACREFGYGSGVEQTIGKALRRRGIESRHGPWRSDLPNPRKRKRDLPSNGVSRATMEA